MIEYEFFSERVPSNLEINSINHLLTLLTTNPVILNSSDLLKIIENSRLLVAKLDGEGEIIGMATLATITIPTGQFGRIEDVVVSSEYRGRGIGKALTQKLIDEARQLGLKRVDLTSNPRRIEANKLYQSLGFEPVETNMYRLKL